MRQFEENIDSEFEIGCCDMKTFQHFLCASVKHVTLVMNDNGMMVSLDFKLEENFKW